MKLDMHCHTMEGSSDAHVSIEEYINILREQGFDGMLVTDHDSYNGYRYYKKHLSKKITDFVVLKGIEYDTVDAGHMIIIMPEKVKLKILEHKGLPVRILIHIVHQYGGIIGPAHPCGEPNLSIFATGKFKKRELSIASRFDFIEGFNSGEDKESNERAMEIARQYDKPVTGGSDSHKQDCVGLAYTILSENIRTEDELIEYFKECKHTECGGEKYLGTIKEHLGRWNKFLVYGFWPYNKVGALVHHKPRKRELKSIIDELEARCEETEQYIQKELDKAKKYQDDFYEHIHDLLEKKEVREMKNYIQHGKSTTYDHCRKVTKTADSLSKKLRIKNLDRRSMLRGAMMHDFFLYDWHIKGDGSHKLHGYHHANKARDNAAEILGATIREQEIVETHMWPLTLTKIPKSKEAWIVCMADKHVSARETVSGIKEKINERKAWKH